MTIEIVFKNNLYWVIAQLPSGNAHDSFNTYQDAYDFIQAFYGQEPQQSEVEMYKNNKVDKTQAWLDAVEENPFLAFQDEEVFSG